MGSIQGVRFCEVIDIKDDSDMDMVKVRILPDDAAAKDLSEIPWAFPLLPKMLHIKPKFGESVLVLLSVLDDNTTQRYYIGPVITQDQDLFFQKFSYATNFMGSSPFYPKEAPSTLSETNGILPKDDEIILRGRKNADIQITLDDVRVKSGVKLVNENNKTDIHFNEYDPAYIKVKYHPNGLIKKEEFTASERKQVNSTVTLVGDKINLISNQPKENDKKYTTTDPDDLIKDEELKKAIEEAYKLPYGEKLVEILKVFINAFVKHTHSFMMLPPVPADGIPELLEKKALLLDREELLSDTVRFN